MTTPTKSVTAPIKANGAATPSHATPTDATPTNTKTNLLPGDKRTHGNGASADGPHPATGHAQHSDVEDYDNMPRRASSGANHRASAEEELENGPSSPPVQWRHPSDALIKGCCNYTASVSNTKPAQILNFNHVCTS